jgi:hypothetical protein
MLRVLHTRGCAGQPGPMNQPMVANEQAANSHVADLIDACQRIPRLEAHAAAGGRVRLVLDGRLGLELTEADACAVIPFIAECVETASRC